MTKSKRAANIHPVTGRERIKRGRHTKLTPETETAIIEAVRNGLTLGSAARKAGVSRDSIFHWMQQFSDFSDRLRAAQSEAATVRIQSNPRPLARARYELRETPAELTQRAYREIMRLLTEGRVPPELHAGILELCMDEVSDRDDDGAVSWEKRFA